ncbi:SprT-like protein [Weissella uvarum]|uniref:SprT family protein n=1 Tax=Weissella uvarum TaxID=1479233 RepID=UPI00195F9E76|nr:SprT family protein [Weissella uvarum]MBM7616867.1 SprT-like protein [Weissella uvarum]MCM0594681.1 SprT family protein [Weissella uvarum]
MTDQELQTLVEKISNEAFQRPFKHQAYFNHRLRTTGGRYLLSNHAIEINPRMLTDFGFDTLVGVIKHELIHYHLHLQGLPYQHRDAEFKQALAKTGALRYAPSQDKAARWHYQCENGHDLYRQRKINVQRYVCGKCQGRLHLVTD